MNDVQRQLAELERKLSSLQVLRDDLGELLFTQPFGTSCSIVPTNRDHRM